jgi:hypothetical protein
MSKEGENSNTLGPERPTGDRDVLMISARGDTAVVGAGEDGVFTREASFRGLASGEI